MLHSYRTNAAEVRRELADQIKSFGFQATVEGKALGLVIAGEIASGIAERSAQTQSAPSVGEWPENSDTDRAINSGASCRGGYKTRKKRLYGWDETNYRTGQMLSFESLMGKVDVTPNLVTMTYDTGEAPARSVSPTGYIDLGDGLRPGSDDITDDD
jgi:hypothetical protein